MPVDGPVPLPGAPLPLNSAAQQPVADELRRVAEEFEAVFLAEMLRPMFDGLDTDGLGGGGMGEEIFRPMLVERYAEAIAASGGVGIADSVVRELMRLQHQAAPEAADGADR
jgi:Rod binding domain-containing protein